MTTQQTERERQTTQLTEARAALALAVKRGFQTEIIARRKAVTALESKLAAIGEAEVVHLSEISVSNAKIDTVIISEYGEYIRNVWTPTPAPTRQPSPQDVKRAEAALDRVNKKWGMC
jgi:hypothetical protein